MAAPDSEDLIHRAKAGDEPAMDELVRRHIGGLRIFIRAQATPLLRQQESASDLVQTVCRELIANLEHYEWRGEGSFRNWLFTMAQNKLRDRRKFYTAHRRDIGRGDPVSVNELGPEDLKQSYQALTSPTQHAIHEEFVEIIESALDRMPANYKEVILLSRIVGLSHAEVATKMATTQGNVRVLLHRALARLASELHPGQSDGSG